MRLLPISRSCIRVNRFWRIGESGRWVERQEAAPPLRAALLVACSKQKIFKIDQGQGDENGDGAKRVQVGAAFGGLMARMGNRGAMCKVHD